MHLFSGLLQKLNYDGISSKNNFVSFEGVLLSTSCVSRTSPMDQIYVPAFLPHKSIVIYNLILFPKPLLFANGFKNVEDIRNSSYDADFQRFGLNGIF